MASPLAPSAPYAQELDVALDAASRASHEIMAIYDAQTASVYEKGDGSPVTDADLAADRVIRDVIVATFPGDALMTEEGENDAARVENRRVWVVDPIDGTAQFVGRTGKFDVLIALVEDGETVVGVAMQPTTGLTHAAVRGAGAWRNAGERWEPFQISPAGHLPRIVGSSYYVDPPGEEALNAVAAALGSETPTVMDVGFQPRALDDAERWYDIFVGLPQDPRVFAAREWDIATSQVVMDEVGAIMSDCWGRRHTYNKRDTHISGGLVVSPSAELHQKVLNALRPLLPETPPAADPADDLA